MALTFDDIDKKFKELVDVKNDTMLLRIVFSSFLANFVEGDPVWLTVIGGAGSGKTELITSFILCERSHSVSSIKPAALLSFSNPEDSLLFEARGKVLVIKDMSTITQANKDEKGLLYGFLRDVYDGEFTRYSGKGKLSWEGKIGFLGAATPAMESSSDFNNMLGERFISIRMKQQNENDVMDRMLIKSTKRNVIRNQLHSMVQMYVDSFSFVPTKLTNKVFSALKRSAKLVASLRTNIIRDHYTKDVIFPAECYESPTRVAGALYKILRVAAQIGSTELQQEEILCRFVKDSIPIRRERTLKFLAMQGAQRPGAIASAIRLSAGQVTRDIQDLALLDLVIENVDKTYQIRDPFLVSAIKRSM